MTDPTARPDDRWSRHHEILREASVALRGEPITLWEISADGGAVAVLGTAPAPAGLDVDSILRRWLAPLVPGSRWVGGLLEGRRWCLAPVRTEPPLPPPGGTERRGRERMILGLAGLSLGLLDQTRLVKRRLDAVAATRNLLRHPSVIAHEVGNPLASALASADLCMEALQGTREPGTPQGAELLEWLTSVTEGITRAVDFLRSVQMETRLSAAEVERFNLVDLARSCVTLEKPFARKHGVTLEFGTSIDETYLVGDSNAMFRALVNLIRNAVSAASPGAEPVAIDVLRSGSEVRVMVRDRGRGIPPEHLEAIFQPGFTTEEQRGGTGVGLAIVKQVAEQQFGGRVEVETRVGQGSVFTLVLPMPPQRSRMA